MPISYEIWDTDPKKTPYRYELVCVEDGHESVALFRDRADAIILKAILETVIIQEVFK